MQYVISQVKGKSKASKWGIYIRDSRIRIFSRAILVRINRQVARSVSASCVRISTVIRAGSRQIRALILDDLLKYVVQDGFWIIRVFYVLGDAKDVTALTNVIFDVLVAAFVRKLGHLDFLGSELLIEVEEIHGRRW